MKDESPIQDRDDLQDDSEQLAPARGVAFGVLLGAVIWLVPTLAFAYWRFVV